MTHNNKKKVTEADIPKRRIRFFSRSPEAPSRLEFSMVRNHIISNYVLENGKEYDLPEDVIKHLHSIKETRTFTEVGGQARTFTDRYYHCEDVEE